MRRKHVPLRSCIACRQKGAKRGLIRIVRTPEGAIEIDPTGKAPGRGAYLCRKQQCWQDALQPHRLAKALHCQVGVEQVAALKALAFPLMEEPAVDPQTTQLGGVRSGE